MKEIRNNILPDKSPTVGEIMEFAAKENLEVSMKPNGENSAKLVIVRDGERFIHFSFRGFQDGDRATHITLTDEGLERIFDQDYENGQRSGELIISSVHENKYIEALARSSNYSEEAVSRFLESYSRDLDNPFAKGPKGPKGPK